MMHQPCEVEDALEFYASMDVGPSDPGITYAETDTPINQCAEWDKGTILCAKLTAMYLLMFTQVQHFLNSPEAQAQLQKAAFEHMGGHVH